MEACDCCREACFDTADACNPKQKVFGDLHASPSLASQDRIISTSRGELRNANTTLGKKLTLLSLASELLLEVIKKVGVEILTTKMLKNS